MTQRPGGLTALAIINFVLGGLYSLGILITVAGFGFLKISDGAIVKEIGTQEMVMFFLSTLLKVVIVALLIVSGIGYLKQKKKLGFLCGNIYAIVSIASSLIVVMIGEFYILSLIEFVYPLATLALLNNVFKDDFY